MYKKVIALLVAYTSSSVKLTREEFISPMVQPGKVFIPKSSQSSNRLSMVTPLVVQDVRTV